MVGHVRTTVSGLNNAVISTPGTGVRSGSERVRDVAGEGVCGSTELLIFERDRRLSNSHNTAVGARTKIMMAKTARAKQVYTLMLSN